jgi:hypothetical protein
MDFAQGAQWGVRLFLGREPRDEDRGLADGVDTPEMLRARLMACEEIQRGLDLVGAYRPEPEPELDWAEGIRWTYRLALRREASDADVLEHSGGVKRLADLRRVFRSREFEIVSPDAQVLADLDVLRQFAPFAEEPVGAHAFRNFVGAETRLNFLHPSLSWKAGQVEGVTRPSAPGLHGLAEWIGSLRSVLEAQDRLTVMELGAGWAPWLVSCALAARKRGITDIRLIGVEGSAEHHRYMREHFMDNGLDPDAFDLHHAVVGAEDGVAYFPKLIDPVADYGASAAFEAKEHGAAAQPSRKVRAGRSDAYGHPGARAGRSRSVDGQRRRPRAPRHHRHPFPQHRCRTSRHVQQQGVVFGVREARPPDANGQRQPAFR